jgi:RNA polymerase sigma-70 factor (ECF subfamily)
MALPQDDQPETLARAVLAGSAEALDRWYRAEHPRVWRVCLGVLADRAEADDVAQDALLSMLDKLRQWDPSRPWSTWRNAVVLNLCRDRLRRRAARARAESQAADERGASELPERLPDPLHVASASEIAELVRAALARLTPREREAFVLVELEGAPAAEAAEALDVGESTVRSLVTLARRRLRLLLGPRLGVQSLGSACEGGSRG